MVHCALELLNSDTNFLTTTISPLKVRRGGTNHEK